jgi:hypothetical protein
MDGFYGEPLPALRVVLWTYAKQPKEVSASTPANSEWSRSSLYHAPGTSLLSASEKTLSYLLIHPSTNPQVNLVLSREKASLEQTKLVPSLVSFLMTSRAWIWIYEHQRQASDTLSSLEPRWTILVLPMPLSPTMQTNVIFFILQSLCRCGFKKVGHWQESNTKKRCNCTH